MSRRTTLTRSLTVGLVIAVTATLPHPADAAAKRTSSVSVAVSISSVTTGAKVAIAGQANPHTRRVVAIQRYSGGRWVQVAKGTTQTNGRYRGTLSVTAAGSYRYRAYLYADRRTRAAVSRTLTVRVATAAKPSTTPQGSKSAFSYLMGTKYRWDPCTPITYAVNPTGAPAGWATDVTGALQRITAASGLQFRSLGTTTVIPRSSGYSTPAKLLIAYVRPGQSDLISVADARNGLAGIGGASGTSVDTATGLQGELVQGEVALSLDTIKALPAGFGKGNPTGYVGTRGQLLMHELAHAMGLGHVNDQLQIMYPMMGSKNAAWGAGDTTGLANVGAKGGCITPLPSSNGRLQPTGRIVKIVG